MLLQTKTNDIQRIVCNLYVLSNISLLRRSDAKVYTSGSQRFYFKKTFIDSSCLFALCWLGDQCSANFETALLVRQIWSKRSSYLLWEREITFNELVAGFVTGIASRVVLVFFNGDFLTYNFENLGVHAFLQNHCQKQRKYGFWYLSELILLFVQALGTMDTLFSGVCTEVYNTTVWGYRKFVAVLG